MALTGVLFSEEGKRWAGFGKKEEKGCCEVEEEPLEWCYKIRVHQ